MIIIKYILLTLMGLAGGVAVAGGVFAFISVMGIIPRMMSRLRLGNYVYQIENVVLAGGLFGTVLTVYSLKVPVGFIGLGVFGLFAGIFVGCVAMALAEVLQVIPILAHRTKLKMGFPVLITAMALGKALGCFYQLGLQ